MMQKLSVKDFTVTRWSPLMVDTTIVLKINIIIMLIMLQCDITTVDVGNHKRQSQMGTFPHKINLYVQSTACTCSRYSVCINNNCDEFT